MLSVGTNVIGRPKGGADMNESSRAVLAAADWWLTAAEAMTAADENQRRTEDQQGALDGAEVALAAAVMTWREAGRPS